MRPNIVPHAFTLQFYRRIFWQIPIYLFLKFCTSKLARNLLLSYRVYDDSLGGLGTYYNPLKHYLHLLVGKTPVQMDSTNTYEDVATNWTRLTQIYCDNAHQFLYDAHDALLALEYYRFEDKTLTPLWLVSYSNFYMTFYPL